MKKILCLLMMLMLAMTLMLVACNQQEQQGSEQGSGGETTQPEPSEGLEFESYGDGTCFVKGIGSCTDTDIVIPEISPNGDRVKDISPFAFSGCTGLTSITIPDSVTEISWGAFADCIGLTSITLPDSVTSIGDYAFRECTGLTSIAIPNSVTSIGTRAFADCIGLTSVTIPDSVTSIDSAFYGCTGLTSITIPDSVTSIYSAFSDCTGLTSITIPDSVTSIDSAFSGCTGLTSITIPDSVTSMDSAFSGCTGLTSITLPDSITSIDSRAFSGCTGLTSITIPDSVTSIGDYAFQECTSLTSITIGDGVTSIGMAAFLNCTGLVGISVGENNTTYFSQDGILYSKADNSILLIPQNITGDVKIADGVTEIGWVAFQDRTGLTSITIPDSVTEISSGAFVGCVGLTSITLPLYAADLNMRVCSNLEAIYYQGTNSEWLYYGGSYYGEQCQIHCSDGDVSAELAAALFAMATDYVNLSGGYASFLEDVESLAEFKVLYDEFLATGIDYEAYAEFQDADPATEEYAKYQQYLDYRTAFSRFNTNKNRRLNEIVNMYQQLQIIKDADIDVDLEAFASVYFPLMLNEYGVTPVYEEGREGDICAITNLEELPGRITFYVNEYKKFVENDYPTTPEEAQVIYDSAVLALVEPGYITQEELEQRISEQN